MFLGRVVGEGEPEWLAEDRDAVLALLAEEAATCPGCGHPQAESMSPDTQGEWEATAIRCFACEEKERESRAFRENGDPAGIWVSVSRADARSMGTSEPMR